jgi:hypothetical protein
LLSLLLLYDLYDRFRLEQLNDGDDELLDMPLLVIYDRKVLRRLMLLLLN